MEVHEVVGTRLEDEMKAEEVFVLYGTTQGIGLVVLPTLVVVVTVSRHEKEDWW